MTMTNTTYTITELNEEHMRVLADALELYTRIRLGQIEVVVEPWESATRGDRTKQTPEKLEAARKILDEAKMVLTGHMPSGSWGIGSEDLSDDARVAHEVGCEIRHRLAWDGQPEGGHGVNFRKVLQWSAQPHPVITKGAAMSQSDSAELAQRREDERIVEGMFLVEHPEPGTPVSRLLSANVLMRRKLAEGVSDTHELARLRAEMKTADAMAGLLGEIVGSGGVVKERAMEEATVLLEKWHSEE
jgi:hypothetical protein